MKASEVDKKPFLWEPDKALHFADIYNLICRFHPEGHAVSREVIACIFFEESAFCNRKQQPGPAVGFGQIQIYDKDKIPFFESIGYNTDKQNPNKGQPFLTYKMVTDSRELSVQITCKYFQWLVGVKGKSRDGALNAQTGGENAKFVPLFVAGGAKLLQAVTNDWTREAFAEALNYARQRHSRQCDSA
jgi:hypothetical protein